MPSWLEGLSFNPIHAHLAREVSRGENPRAYARHGMSVHTLIYGRNYGVLPGKTTPDEYFRGRWIRRGDLYCHLTGDPGYPPGNAARAVKGYAQLVAEKHQFLWRLNIPFDNADLDGTVELVDYYCQPRPEAIHRQALYGVGKTDAEIDRAIADARKVRGVVIGLNDKIRRYPMEDVGDYSDDGWVIQTGGAGVPYDCIDGIAFQNRYDRQLYEQLK